MNNFACIMKTVFLSVWKALTALATIDWLLNKMALFM